MTLLAAMRDALAAELRAYYLRGTPLAAPAERQRCAAIFAVYSLTGDRARACAILARATESRIRRFARHPALEAWLPDACALAVDAAEPRS